MSKYHVISEFIDAETGDTRLPGDVVDFDDDRALNALQIGVISDTAPVIDEPAADGEPNESWTIKQLREYAEAREIEITATKKADILFEILLAKEADASEDEPEAEEAEQDDQEAGTDE